MLSVIASDINKKGGSIKYQQEHAILKGSYGDDSTINTKLTRHP